MTAKFLAVAMAAGLLVGATAVSLAQQSRAPGQRIEGGTASPRGFAPGHEGTTGAAPRDDGMGRDRDDRMRSDDDDRMTGAGDRDDRMLGHEHDEGR